MSATRSTWPRSRPCRRGSASARPASPRGVARGLELTVDGERAPLRVARAPRRRAAGGGRPEDAALRRGLRDRGDRDDARVPRTATSGRGSAGRKWSCARATAPSCASPASRREPERRAARLPAGPAPSPARRHDGDCLVRPRRGRGHAPRARGGVAGGRASRRRLRGADLARRPRRVGVVLLSLAIAAFWGAAHALTPGHGKAIVAGYLVGTKGTAASTRCCSAGS